MTKNLMKKVIKGLITKIADHEKMLVAKMRIMKKLGERYLKYATYKIMKGAVNRLVKLANN
jgi:hypothetical protein